MDFTCATTKFETPAKSVFIYFNMTSEQLIGCSTDSLVRHTTVQRTCLEMKKIYIAILHSSKANQNKHIVGVYKG